jgi:hypothetical protein
LAVFLAEKCKVWLDGVLVIFAFVFERELVIDREINLATDALILIFLFFHELDKVFKHAAAKSSHVSFGVVLGFFVF